MNQPTPYNYRLNEQGWIFGMLALLMSATRFHHEGTAFALPDASLAVFFLAGAFLPRSRAFFLLLGLAFIIDYLAVTALGVRDYCFSPAYAFLVPTYAVMWFGGRWFYHRLSDQSWKYKALIFWVSLAVPASLAFLISNGSFFWFSGKVASVSLMEYAMGLADGYLPYVGATLLYAILGLGVVALMHNLAHIRQERINSL